MAGLDAECPICGYLGDVRPGTPYPAQLECPECGETFHEDAEPIPLLGVL